MEQLTLFQEDSLVSPTQWPEKDLEKKMTDTSGQRCLESFRKFSRHGLWAKMFSDLLIGQEGWYSTKCRLIWKLKGTKYNRMYFQLYPSMLPTEETESGLLPTPRAITIEENVDGWQKRMDKRIEDGMTTISPNLHILAMRGMLPTPTAMDSSNATANMKSTQVKEGSMHSVTLARAMAMGMLPTPTVQDGNKATKKWREDHQNNLTAHVFNKMLPTPTSTDYKGAYSPDSMVSKDGIDRANLLRNIYVHTGDEWKQKDGKTSQLNPQFVMEMMGFPTDWTLLPFLNGEQNQSRPEEMP